MAVNNFKPFGVGKVANVTAQADYEALPALDSGFSSGKASSAQINKALRQGTVMSSVLAQFIANLSGKDVLDDGNTQLVLNNLIAALKANGSKDFLQTANNLAEINAAGPNAVANALANLGLERIQQDTTETRLRSPSKNQYIFINDNIWGAYSSTKKEIVSLPINCGGTGASTPNTARTNLGLGSASTRDIGTGNNQIPDMTAFTSGSGWVRFPDGTIIQRGTSISGYVGFPSTIQLPIPFTQGDFKVVTSFDKADHYSSDCPAFATTPIGTVGFYLMSSRASEDTGAGANWIAIGQ